MSARYWSAKDILRQVAGELGLLQASTVTSNQDTQSMQLLSLLNAAGNELLNYYPWEQLAKEWSFDTVVSQSDYDVPDDWAYFTDQTQWDRTNHWPLLGPKTPQEWAWLKGALVAALPRLRYRVQNNQLKLFPAPSVPTHLAMEYISKNWVLQGDTPTDMIVEDGDMVLYNPWLMIKFVKFKFYELKQLDTAGVNADFMRVYNALTGKDTGAKVLSLSPEYVQPYLGPWSVPDGSWNVHGST